MADFSIYVVVVVGFCDNNAHTSSLALFFGGLSNSVANNQRSEKLVIGALQIDFLRVLA